MRYAEENSDKFLKSEFIEQVKPREAIAKPNLERPKVSSEKHQSVENMSTDVRLYHVPSPPPKVDYATELFNILSMNENDGKTSSAPAAADDWAEFHCMFFCI